MSEKKKEPILIVVPESMRNRDFKIAYEALKDLGEIDETN